MYSPLISLCTPEVRPLSPRDTPRVPRRDSLCPFEILPVYPGGTPRVPRCINPCTVCAHPLLPGHPGRDRPGYSALFLLRRPLYLPDTAADSRRAWRCTAEVLPVSAAGVLERPGTTGDACLELAQDLAWSRAMNPATRAISIAPR